MFSRRICPNNLACHHWKLDILLVVSQQVFVECLLWARHCAVAEQETRQTEQALGHSHSLSGDRQQTELLNWLVYYSCHILSSKEIQGWWEGALTSFVGSEKSLLRMWFLSWDLRDLKGFIVVAGWIKRIQAEETVYTKLGSGEEHDILGTEICPVWPWCMESG